mmetsp:Transcript_17620/g.38366  ORF Transcript_17620/g.38366 Transcript_17620/m.38366 type:complete len:230 (+) Transcript_17620:1059-1748(+)
MCERVSPYSLSSAHATRASTLACTVLSCSCISDSLPRTSSTNSGGARSTKPWLPSRFCSTSMSLVSFSPCLPRRACSLTVSMSPDCGRKASTPSSTIRCTQGPAAATSMSASSSTSISAPSSARASSANISRSCCSSRRTGSLFTLSTTASFLPGSTLYSARALRMLRTSACRLSKVRTASASTASGEFPSCGQGATMMLSPWCGICCQSVSVRYGMKGCSRRMQVSHT